MSTIYTEWAEKIEQILVTILVVWQLLSGFCLTHPMLCERDNRVKVSALLRAEHKVSEVANLAGMSQEAHGRSRGVNRLADNGWKIVVDPNSLRDAFQGSPRTSMRQYVRKLVVGAPTVRRTVAKFGAKSRVIVERPLLTPAIRANALNIARWSLMTSCLLQLEEWSSSQMRRLGRSILCVPTGLHLLAAYWDQGVQL